MGAAETGFVELPDTCSTAEALRKYSGHKSWSTRYMNKVSNSQPLLDKSYDCRTDEIVSENIHKAKYEAAAMGMISEFLVQKKYEKAKDHLDEVEELEVEVAAAWDRYTTIIHARAAAANAPASPAARRPLPQLIPTLSNLWQSWNLRLYHMMLLWENYASGVESTRLTIMPLTCSWREIKFSRPICWTASIQTYIYVWQALLLLLHLC